MTPTSRFKTPSALVLALCVGGLASALVLQYGFDMLPCPFCVAQRLVLLVIAAFALTGLVLQGGAAQRIARAGMRVGAAAGAAVALVHIYKVYAPTTATTCGSQGFGTWLDHLWITDLAPWLLAPLGDCMLDAASVFGFPLPALAVALFAGIFLATKFKCN